MKKIFGITLSLCFALCARSQNANVTWGDDFKMKKGSTDLSVIHADKTGIYVREGHKALKGYFVIAATTRESATLIKLDKGFEEEYKSDFNKELKGKEFEDLFFIKDRLYLMASSYKSKDRTLTLFAAEINKADGQQKGDWMEVASWQKEEKSNDLDFNITYNADSTKMVVVSTDEGKEKITYDIKEYDEKMKAVGAGFSISNEFDRKTFQLEDVICTVNGNVMTVGRVYEYQEGKKKKAKFLDFKSYNIRLYNNTGTMIKEINTEVNAKWLVSTKVAQIPDRDVVLAAFYSNTKKGKEINGILVQRIDPATGDVISTSEKELNTSMISAVDDEDDADDDDESKQERKERKKLEKIQEDEDGFSKYLRFRDFVYTADKGVVILAEKYHHYTYESFSGGSGGIGGFGGRTTTYDVHECGDMMMSKLDEKGNITWLHVLPKNQRETIMIGSRPNYGGFSIGVNYFNTGFNYPFYAGMGSITVPGKNTVSIMFNDHTKNENVINLGQKVKATTRFGRSDCYLITLDAATGQYKRTSLFSNKDQPTAMIRLGVPVGKDFYIVGKDDKLTRQKIAVGKITFK